MSISRILKTRMARSLLVAGLIIGLYLLNIGTSFGRMLTGLTQAMSRGVYAATATSGNFLAKTFRWGGADNAAVINQLKVENAELRVLLAENEALKNALNFTDRVKRQLVLAKVISVQRDDTAQVLIIDRGTVDNLKNGQAVLTPTGVVIGKILQINSQTANVLLLTDIKSRLGVTIQNSKETLGILEGNRGLNTIITLIPRASNVAVGDTVVTSGIDPGIPRGLVVGSIAKVGAAAPDPFQSAVVASLAETQYPILVQVLVGNN